MPRFDQSFTGICEQNLQDTLQLKQRFLDSKNKRQSGPKTKQEKKQSMVQDSIVNQQPSIVNTSSSSIQSSVHVQQKFLKRSATGPDELDPGGVGALGGSGPTPGGDGPGSGFEPPVKLQCTTQHSTATSAPHNQSETGLTKFSVEIVQQLEFTTSAANSQPQQISTNVTVKAHTNASVKTSTDSNCQQNQQQAQNSPAQGGAATTDNGAANGQQQQQQQQQSDKQQNENGGGLGDCCVKQEPDNDFADLDQCAAALEKDAAANGGTGFGGLSDLMGDDTNDAITSDALKELISDITNYPEFMREFDFGSTGTTSASNSVNNDKLQQDQLLSGLKVEDIKDFHQQVDNKSGVHGNGLQQQQNNPNSNFPLFEHGNKLGNRMAPFHPGMDFVKTELSPAAQTLKQMAEQHQHKNQVGSGVQMGVPPPSSQSPFGQGRPPGSNNPRSPYHTEFHSPFQGATAGSDYGSPQHTAYSPQIGINKNSPGFPSPHHQQESITIKQEQMLFQQQQGGQTSDLDGSTAPIGGGKRKSNLYKQQYSPYGSPAGGHGSPGYLPGRTPGSNAFGGGTPPRPPSGPGGGNNGGGSGVPPSSSGNTNTSSASLQINQAQQLHVNQQSGGIQVSAGQQLHLSGDIKGNVSIAAQQGMHFNQQQSQQQQNNQQQTPQQQHPHSQQSQQPNQPGNVGGPQQQNPLHPTGVSQGGMLGSGNMMGSSVGVGVGSPANLHHHQLSQQQQMMGNGDSYSMSQTQTINFTQQSLRQRNPTSVQGGMNGLPTQMGNSGQMGMASGNPITMSGMRHMTPQGNPSMMEQKLLQQQQMLRVQQQQSLMAQQAQQHLIRPPPPDYKSSAMMQQSGMVMSGQGQPRYTTGGIPPSMRRMPHQAIPPSGPMLRGPHGMYMMQQQQQIPNQQQQMGMGPGPGGLRGMYPAASRQQPPLDQIVTGPQSHNTGNVEWRQLMMQQQSSQFSVQQQQGPMRSSFQHSSQGFGMGSTLSSSNGNANTLQQQHQMAALQQMRMQQQQQGLPVMGGGSGGNMPPQSNMNLLGQHPLMGSSNTPMSQMQQQLMMQQQQQSLMSQQQQNNGGPGSQISVSNLHMQQSQSLSISSSTSSTGQGIPQSMQGVLMGSSNAGNANNTQSNALSSFNAQSDFNLDLFENMPNTDATSAFTEQELLNSFDSDSGFLQDIL